MNVVVFMKQVPDTESELEVREDGKGIECEDVKMVINPYDEYALEEALRIKESGGAEKVTVISVGPDSVPEAIRVAYAMGVDEAIHVNDEIDEDVYGAVDPYTTAKIISSVLKDLSYDLVIAGQRAVDGDNYLVPAYVAEMSGLPMISGVVHQQIENGAVICRQLVEGGTATVKTPLPAILTTQKGLNEPRYPNFRAIMKAKNTPFDEKEIDDLGLSEEEVGVNCARVKIRSLTLPIGRTGGKIIEGASPAAKAAELVRLLKEERQAI